VQDSLIDCELESVMLRLWVRLPSVDETSLDSVAVCVPVTVRDGLRDLLALSEEDEEGVSFVGVRARLSEIEAAADTEAVAESESDKVDERVADRLTDNDVECVEEKLRERLSVALSEIIEDSEAESNAVDVFDQVSDWDEDTDAKDVIVVVDETEVDATRDPVGDSEIDRERNNVGDADIVALCEPSREKLMECVSESDADCDMDQTRDWLSVCVAESKNVTLPVKESERLGEAVQLSVRVLDAVSVDVTLSVGVRESLLVEGEDVAVTVPEAVTVFDSVIDCVFEFVVVSDAVPETERLGVPLADREGEAVSDADIEARTVAERERVALVVGCTDGDTVDEYEEEEVAVSEIVAVGVVDSETLAVNVALDDMETEGDTEPVKLFVADKERESEKDVEFVTDSVKEIRVTEADFVELADGVPVGDAVAVKLSVRVPDVECVDEELRDCVDDAVPLNDSVKDAVLLCDRDNDGEYVADALPLIESDPDVE
jgi:hypothetical protein